MGSTSSPDPTTAPFEFGMLRLVLQLEILLRGTLTRCCPLLTPLMGSVSSPDLRTTPFDSGMPRLVHPKKRNLSQVPSQGLGVKDKMIPHYRTFDHKQRLHVKMGFQSCEWSDVVTERENDQRAVCSFPMYF